jgi:MFS family permease
MADRIGGKYILFAGVLLFTVGMGSIALVAGPDSTWINFLIPAVIAGLGIGMTFAPMTAIAMRNIEPRVAGSASAVLNTIRQLGAAVGSAVIGALLQNRLAVTLHDQAVSHASALPAAFQAQFVAAFTNISSKGFQIGTGQSGAQLPAGIPAAVAHQLAALAHDVFVSGYIDAMKQTFLLPIAFLFLTALSALLIKRDKASTSASASGEQAQPKEEEYRAAVG